MDLKRHKIFHTFSCETENQRGWSHGTQRIYSWECHDVISILIGGIISAGMRVRIRYEIFWGRIEFWAFIKYWSFWYAWSILDIPAKKTLKACRPWNYNFFPTYILKIALKFKAIIMANGHGHANTLSN